MPAYKYDTVDGQKVEKNVAAQYRRARADFEKETGLKLYVSSGIRTQAEQQAGYNAYVARGYTGTKWAKPSESSHCEVGPSGPRALDIRDSGRDAGVTVKGSALWEIFRRIGAKYGFTWGGWGVPASEGWHWENHQVKVGVYDAAPASTGKATPASKYNPADMLKWRWTGIQRMLKGTGRYTSRIDNIPGDGSVRGIQKFVGVKVDGKFGPDTVKGIQRWLKRRWGYTGDIDGLPGAGTLAAWNKAEAANGRAFSRVG